MRSSIPSMYTMGVGTTCEQNTTSVELHIRALKKTHPPGKKRLMENRKNAAPAQETKQRGSQRRVFRRLEPVQKRHEQRPGANHHRRAQSRLARPLGPMMAWTSPAPSRRLIPFKIDWPSTLACKLTISNMVFGGLSDRAFKTDGQKFLRFHGEFHG